MLQSIRIRKLNCTQRLEKMARKHLKEKQILSLIVSLQNLWSSALVIYRIINAMIACKMQRKCLLNLLLTDGSRRIPKIKPNCKPCQCWIRPGRTNGWWLGFHQNRVAPSEWKENFRVSRESFLALCTELNEHVVKSSTRFRKAVSVEEQVALMVYCLSDKGRLRKTANAFGLGKSAASHIIHRVCKAITVHLTSKYIKMPRTEETAEESVSKFYSKYGFPQCTEDIDGTHKMQQIISIVKDTIQ